MVLHTDCIGEVASVRGFALNDARGIVASRQWVDGHAHDGGHDKGGEKYFHGHRRD